MYFKRKRKCKRKEKKLDKIGKIIYDFDFELEKDIYDYVCCEKKCIKLEEKFLFDYYHEWERYVQDKYVEYSEEKLYDFSKYLKLRLKNVAPDHEQMNIYIALLMTYLITEIFDVIKPAQLSISEESLVADVILFGIVFVIIIIPVVLIVLIFAKMFLRITKSYHKEKNLLEDYIEIIENMIKERKQLKKED